MTHTRALLFLVLGLLVWSAPVYAQRLTHEGTARWESGETKSLVLPANERCLVGIQIPAAFTGTSMTAECSVDGDTFASYRDGNGNEWSITVATSLYIGLQLSGDPICDCKYIKLVSGSSEAARRLVPVQFTR